VTVRRVGQAVFDSVLTLEGEWKESTMSESLVDDGLHMVCETCESEIDFPDEIASEVGICRQCGIAFLVGRLAEDSSNEGSGSQSA
jgi:hypothetical protein